MQILPVQLVCSWFSLWMKRTPSLLLCSCCKLGISFLLHPPFKSIPIINAHLRLSFFVKSSPDPWIGHPLVISLSFEVSVHSAIVPMHTALDFIIYQTLTFWRTPQLYLLKTDVYLILIKVPPHWWISCWLTESEVERALLGFPLRYVP